jgi:hypothetical protein
MKASDRLGCQPSFGKIRFFDPDELVASPIIATAASIAIWLTV